MENVLQWITFIRADVVRLFEQVVDYLPQLIGGILLVVVGWLVARLLRALTFRVVGGWDWLIQKLTIGRMVTDAEARQTSISVAGTVVYWVTILFFVTAAAQVLNLELFSAWLNRVIVYIPTAISAVLIVIIGFVLGSYARDAIQRRVTSATQAQRELLAGAARFAIIVTAFVVGLDVIGVETSALVTVIGIAIAVMTGGSALAFGFGARTLVSNLIGARQVRRQCQVGDVIRIGGAEGRILSLGQSFVMLETAEGRMMVPGKLFAEESSLVLYGEVDDG